MEADIFSFCLHAWLAKSEAVLKFSSHIRSYLLKGDLFSSFTFREHSVTESLFVMAFCRKFAMNALRTIYHNGQRHYVEHSVCAAATVSEAAALNR